MYALPPARWQRSLATSGASLLSGAFAISFSVARVLAFERIDRKSTRLNSSHGYISYAVFCLKKNKDTVPGEWVMLVVRTLKRFVYIEFSGVLELGIRDEDSDYVHISDSRLVPSQLITALA